MAMVEKPRWWWVYPVVGVLVIVGCAGPGVAVNTDNTGQVNDMGEFQLGSRLYLREGCVSSSNSRFSIPAA